MSDRAAEKNLGFAKWICLACGSPLTGYEMGFKTDEDGDSLRRKCSICFEERQVISFERLVTESERFRELVDEIELRYDCTGGGGAR